MKRSQIKRRPLADSVLKTLEPEAKGYREADGNGLYFSVKPSGAKAWVLRYKNLSGKWAWKGLGGFPGVSGKLARRLTQELQELASNGEDLAMYKADVRGVQEVEQAPEPEGIPFRQIAKSWYTHQKNSGRSWDTLDQYERYLEKDIYPALGEKTIDQVTRADCAAIQAGIEERGAHEVAKKVRGWLSQMYSRAIGQGLIEYNPASELNHLAQDYEKNHYPHLFEDELPAFLQALRESKSRRATQIMVWLILRTACRPGMARWAEWSEFDLDNALWSVPGSKMKKNRDYLVPLARQTVEDLQELKDKTGQGRYLFPGTGSVNPVVSENTVNKSLRGIGYKDKLVGHGARHTASTLLNEHNWEYRVVETQLAHKLQGVGGVYNKAQYLNQRKMMMQWYADYLDWLETGEGDQPKDPVIQLPG